MAQQNQRTESRLIRTIQNELAEENFRAAVELEKARLRVHRSFWARVASLVPFTITWRKK